MNSQKTNYTPGPWLVNQYGDRLVVVTQRPERKLIRGICVVRLRNHRDEEIDEDDAPGVNDANAYLIAAAPDLFAAAERARIVLALHGASNRATAKELSAAIAKATGG